MVEQRGALQRGLGYVDPRNPKILPFVLDRVNLGRVGVDAMRPVQNDGVVVPGPVPQLVHHFQVLVGDVVAIIVPDLSVQPDVPRAAVQIRGDDVPADAAVGEVVKRRHTPREDERMLVGR